jgi:murein DD-endopeptidase MepM/ murein hydrolase activator NlpD
MNYYFYNARHYDPEIGRFVTADTVIDGELSTQGWNRYSYCRNNPIIYRDPTGHDARDSIWSVADAVGEKIRNVGEGIRNVGEKVTQPLRNAGEWLRDKLQGNKESANNRTGKSNNAAFKPSIVNGVEVPLQKDSLPYITSYYGDREITNAKGEKVKQFHPGVDAVPQKNAKGQWMMKEERRGTPIINLGDGKVKFAGEKEGYGKTVIIDHGKGVESLYAHLDDISVQTGQSLKKGNQVGDLGYTGSMRGTGPHIHWEIRKDGRTINPKGTSIEMETK